jgi:hypothetical protein
LNAVFQNGFQRSVDLNEVVAELFYQFVGDRDGLRSDRFWEKTLKVCEPSAARARRLSSVCCVRDFTTSAVERGGKEL